MAFKSSRKQSRMHLGFTLVELLLVIAILGVLATLSLVVLRGAQEDARSARTQSIISQIREILLDKLDRIETRAMPLNVDQVISGANLVQRQFLRKRMLMEWVLAELPSYYEDLDFFPSERSREVNNLPGNINDWPSNWADNFRVSVGSRPPAGLLGIRRNLSPGVPPFDPWDHAGGDSPPSPLAIWPYNARLRNDPNVQSDSVQFRNSLIEGSECLYAILYNTWFNDQRGIHFLSPSEIGDLDDDGRPEVLDAWGEPLYFLVRRNLEIDSNGDGIVNDVDRDVNGDLAVNHFDSIIDPSNPVFLSEIVIELFSMRSNQF